MERKEVQEEVQEVEQEVEQDNQWEGEVIAEKKKVEKYLDYEIIEYEREQLARDREIIKGRIMYTIFGLVSSVILLSIMSGLVL